jgi:hypothetical protein
VVVRHPDVLAATILKLPFLAMEGIVDKKKAANAAFNGVT